MSIQKIKSGRQTNTTAEQYIGGLGTIFYNESVGDLRLGDGVTPGGIPLLLGGNNNNGGDLPIATAAILGGVVVGGNLSVTNTGLLSVDFSAVNQDIIPSQNAVYSLGSAEFKWKDLHVSLGSIYLGDVKLSSVDGSLTISDDDDDLTPDSDPATVLRAVKNVDTYINLSIQNLNPGTNASSDILLYNDLDPTIHYADFGISSSHYSDGSILKPNDIYILGSGGDVKIGATLPGKDVVFFVGGTNDHNEVARFTNGGLLLEGDILFSNGNIFSGSYNDLSDKPNIFSGNYADLTNTPSVFSGSYNDLTNKPNLFSGNYSDLFGIPNLFPGSYTDLTNKPNIPTDVNQLNDIDHLLGGNSIAIKSHGSILTSKPQSINFEGALTASSDNGSDIMVSLDSLVIGFQIDGGYPFSIYGGVDPIDAGVV